MRRGIAELDGKGEVAGLGPIVSLPLGILAAFIVLQQQGINANIMSLDDSAEAGLLDAIREGTVLRVRPKAMTATVIIAGLLPIMWGSGTGSEIMQRIAAPMVGMITAPLMSMFVMPAVYLLIRRRGLGKTRAMRSIRHGAPSRHGGQEIVVDYLKMRTRIMINTIVPMPIYMCVSCGCLVLMETFHHAASVPSVRQGT